MFRNFVKNHQNQNSPKKFIDLKKISDLTKIINFKKMNLKIEFAV